MFNGFLKSCVDFNTPDPIGSIYELLLLKRNMEFNLKLVTIVALLHKSKPFFI
jgi:hypothetical protein